MVDLYLICSNAAIVLISIILIGGIASLIREVSIKAYLRLFGYGMAKFIDNRLTFIGVIHHELSHLLVGIISGAKINDFALFKVRDGTLGYVDIVPRGPFIFQLIQKALCGMAPIICGSITLYTLYYYGLYLRNKFDYVTVIIVILMLQISHHMSMSKQDIKIAAKGIWLVYLLIAIALYIFPIDLIIYKHFLICIFAILAINIILSLIIGVIASIIRG